MRIAFLLHPKMVRVPFDPARLEDDPRGLTGSEVAFFRYAQGLAARGHYVVAFSKYKEQGLSYVQDANLLERGITAGLYCEPYGGGVRCEDWESMRGTPDGLWDACVAWTCAEPLFKASKDCFRLLNHQCNGFSTSPPGWEGHVDVVAPLSNTHAKVLTRTTRFPKDKFRLMPNGVDASEFRAAPKVPGRMIWASSHDRGLHHLLEMFPRVRKAVPGAELHVFYDQHSVKFVAAEGPRPTDREDMHELRRRAQYILFALSKLEGHGVVVHGATSRARMREEMAKASVLAYTLSPVYFTETFGVVVLEALACGTLPVLCFDDAFPELWSGVAVGVEAPLKVNVKAYERLLLGALGEPERFHRWREPGVERAGRYDWGVLVPRLERCLETRGAEGLEEVDWS